jgi:glucose-1-phosphate thymidylyltransferase
VGLTGIVPAAGSATRLQPLAGSKEVLSIGGRPVMDYLVDRMRRAGSSRIRVITRAEKEDVVRRALELGAEVVLGQPPVLAASILLGLAALPDDEIVLLGFPDSVWEPPDAFIPLRRMVERGSPIAIGLFETDDPGSGDVVEVGEDAAVGTVLARIESKPADPAGPWIWGCLAGRAGALRDLQPGEDVAALLRRAAMSTPVPAIRLGRIVDIGTRATLRTAEADAVVRAARRRRPIRP